jgi:glycosyltransferase involved in cell wall biosynthesis
MEAEMKRVATMVFAYYPHDVRARRQCQALAESGIEVDVICLKNAGESDQETVDGVKVYRVPIRKQRAGKLTYIVQYLGFVLRAFLKLSRLHLSRRYHCIHAHNMPDILVFAALLPKLMGAKVLLDLRDPMPEVFMTNFSVKRSHPFIRLLILLERLSVKFADSAITPNIAFRELFISRGCPPKKIAIVMNSPMESIFTAAAAAPAQEGMEQPKFVVMFHGTIFDRHGVDTALEAVSEVRKEIPGLEFRVFGDGDFSPYERYVKKYQLEDVVKYGGMVSLEQIAEEIGGIDVGIVPNKKTPFTDLNFPVRIFEYLSLGKPVIAPRTRGVLDYFQEGSIFFFDAGSAASLTDAIREVYRDREAAREVVESGRQVYQQHRWELQKKKLVQQVNSLSGG